MIQFCVIVCVVTFVQTYATEFLYEQYPSNWKTEEFVPSNNIMPVEYEHQMPQKPALSNEQKHFTSHTIHSGHNSSSTHEIQNKTSLHEALFGYSRQSEHVLDVLESFSSETSFYNADYYDFESSNMSEINNDAALQEFLQFLHFSNCTPTGANTSVMCCTFPMDNTSVLSTICSNETLAPFRHHHQHRPQHMEMKRCPKHKWEPLLNMICVPTFCLFGLCGNTLSFFVMCGSAYRRKSYGHYLRALAVFDNLTLIINLVFTLNDFIVRMNDTHSTNGTYTGLMEFHTTATCKITEFMRHVVYLMSSWLVVCFTVDRFIAVCFPLLRVRYCTERCAIYTTLILLAAIMLSQTYHFVYIERLDRLQNPHRPCHASPSVRLTYFGLNYFWFSFLLRFTLPFFAIAMCNGCIIYHIARMRKGRRAKETRRKQQASLAIYTLYAVCACFVITMLPNAVVTIIQFSSFFANQRMIDLKLYCMLQTVYTPFHILRLVNYSANCVLYGVAGRQFRQEFCKVLWCCIGRSSYDKRSLQSPEPLALKADLLLTSRKNGNTIIRIK